GRKQSATATPVTPVLSEAVSGVVLPLADRSEDAHRIGNARAEVLVDRGDHRGLGTTQKRVSGFFLAQPARQRGLAGFAQAAVALFAGGERGVAGLDTLGEADVRERVF